MPRRNRYQPRQITSDLPPGSRVLIYCRYSGEQQDDSSQRMELERAIDARSGSTDRRPGFQALVARTHEMPKPADGIVAWKGDRISRDQLDAGYYKADLRRRGYVLHFLKDDIPEGPMARIYESLLEWKAEQDLRDISANTIRGQQATVRMALEVDGQTMTGFSSGGIPPRGYRRSAPIRTGARRNGDPRFNVRWEPDPAWWPAARRAIELLIEGRTYADILAETGLFRTPGTLSTWLRSPALYGRRVHGEAVVEDAHERLITADEEALVLARLREARARGMRQRPRRVTSTYLLSGLIVCGPCVAEGRSGAMKAHESHSGRWYRCSWKAHGGYCPLPMVPADDAERVVIDGVLGYLTPEVLQPYQEAIRRAADELVARQQELAEWLPAAIDAAERKVGNLARALTDGYSQALRTELTGAESEVARLRQQRATLRRAVPAVSEQDMLDYLAQIRADLADGEDLAERRRTLGLAVARIVATAEHLEVEWQPIATKAMSGYGLAPRTRFERATFSSGG